MKKASIILLAFFLAASVFLGGFFLGRHLDGEKVQISQKTTPTTQPTANQTTPEQDTDDGLININTATAQELMNLPNIGQVIAGRIVEYRKENGPFQSLGELTEVDGIGEKRLEGILQYITLEE